MFSVTSSGGPYKAGDTVPITITFTRPATVADTGIPSLSLDTGSTAHYTSGSGSTRLVFNYVVEPGHSSTNLNYVGINSLELNDGSIVSTDDPNTRASLTLPEIFSDRSLGGSNIVIDTTIPVFISGTTGVTTVNAATETVVYDANATDNGGEIADVGITYTLGDTNANLFNIDATSGTVTYRTIQTSTITHDIMVIATDAAGNTATQTVMISVLDIPMVTITDNINRDPDIANIADGEIIFTFTFSEPVDDFTIDDIEVSGGTTGLLTVSSPGMVWNLPVSPFPNIDNSTIVITVTENAVRNVHGFGNNVTSVTQTYDTRAPNPPTIHDVAGDNTINAAEITGSSITGTTEEDTEVALNFGGIDRSADVTGTNWRYTLTNADILAMGEGEETITTTATDIAGNASQPSSKNIVVDTVIPTVTFDTNPAVGNGGSTNASTLIFTATLLRSRDRL